MNTATKFSNHARLFDSPGAGIRSAQETFKTEIFGVGIKETTDGEGMLSILVFKDYSSAVIMSRRSKDGVVLQPVDDMEIGVALYLTFARKYGFGFENHDEEIYKELVEKYGSMGVEFV